MNFINFMLRALARGTLRVNPALRETLRAYYENVINELITAKNLKLITHTNIGTLRTYLVTLLNDYIYYFC